jgi:hypothetical protein
MSSPAQNLQSDRSKFPGLRPAEAAVLKDWLALHEGEYQRIDYNVRVGPGVDPGSDVAPAIRTNFIQSTQLRIDAVVWNGDSATLIEVKDRATPGAIGQLLTYSHYWQQSNRDAGVPKLLIIARSDSAGVGAAALTARIAFEIVATR